MDRHAARLVDDQNVAIFVQNREFGARHRCCRCFFGNTDWRNPHHVSQFQAIQLVNPALVDADFPGTQDAVNMAFRDAFADPQQIIIDSLSRIVFGDGNKGGLRLDRLMRRRG